MTFKEDPWGLDTEGHQPGMPNKEDVPEAVPLPKVPWEDIPKPEEKPAVPAEPQPQREKVPV